jgi:hypothetical protein
MTAQCADILLYRDEKYYIYAEPLANYLKRNALPYPLVAPNTACWRGYTATYVVQNDKLFLTEWNGYIQDYIPVGIDYLFPGETFMFADWFTGAIAIGDLGRLIVFDGQFSIHEGELLLQFENGVLIKEYEKWLSKEEADRLEEEYKNLPF